VPSYNVSFNGNIGILFLLQVVRFSGIKFTRKFEISNNGYETFGKKLVACFVGPLKTLLQRKKSKWMQILRGVDGYIMPGSMTLLLGPPGQFHN
jgi:hypothetical protein